MIAELRLWRILFAHRPGDPLSPAAHPEGRFHHSGQPALYASPSLAAAHVSIDSYYRSDDPPRVTVPLRLAQARLADLRSPAAARNLGVDFAATIADWRAERADGRPVLTWPVGDRIRQSGMDGMLYTSRKAPPHWHVVLFSWNDGGGARLSVDGRPIPFDPESTATGH